MQKPIARLAFERGSHDTAGRIELSEFGLEDPDRRRYEPSGWFALRRGLRGYRVGPDDVFVDFGSGKGRIVTQAARYPFRRVVGVEIADELTKVARANVQSMLPRLRCKNVELVTADVRDFEIPDDLTVAYLSNPFGGEVFQAVLDKLVESIERAPRRVRLIYLNPVMADEVSRTGRFELVRRSRGLRPDVASRLIHVYEGGAAPHAAERRASETPQRS